VLACGVLAATASAVGLVLGSQTGRAAVPVGRPRVLAVPRGEQAAPPGPATAARVPAPARLVIPAIGVDTRLARLHLTAARTLQPPPSAAVAGWYAGGPRPGAIGPAVIVGHIDSLTGPAVFFRLRLLRPGDRVYVRRVDGSLAVFMVTAVHSYPKSRFPTAAVYGPVRTAQLRLVTCGGTFDPATGSYLRNVIAYATLVH
jgi:sortase (surface protein transpeptidase)